LGACLNTGRALDTLLRIDHGDEAFQVTEDVVRTDVNAFATIFAKVL
jgi:hypothetical protein